MGRGPFRLVGNTNRWPEVYTKSVPDYDPDYRYMQLWLQENPNPNRMPSGSIDDDNANYDAWWIERSAIMRRVRLIDLLPSEFEVMDWTQEQVDAAYAALPGRCGVCGRINDAGCVLGC